MGLRYIGLFLCLAVICVCLLQFTQEVWFAVAASAFAIASVTASISVIQTYKGEKRQ